RLRRLVERCLARDARTRLRDIGEARIVLEDLIHGSSDPVTAAAAPAGTNRLPWAIAAIAVVAFTVQTWRQFRSPAAPPGLVTRSRIELKDISGFLNVSRDGTKIAYAVTGGPRGAYLSLRQTDQLEGKPIPGADEAEFPILSPDGQWVAYSRTQIRKIPVT